MLRCLSGQPSGPLAGRRTIAGTCSTLPAVTEILDITTKHCTVERDGPVVILTMNRPEKKNALSGDMLAGLVLGYEYIDSEPEVRCAILTGAGGNFSSGADLVAMGQQSDDERVQA